MARVAVLGVAVSEVSVVDTTVLEDVLVVVAVPVARPGIVEVPTVGTKVVNGTESPATAEAPAKAGEPAVAPIAGASISFGFKTLESHQRHAFTGFGGLTRQ
jgi:hypothetical protein